MSDTKYCPVTLEDFVGEQNANYQIYVRMSADKYVKIANGIEELNQERLDHYKSKGMERLFVKKEDFEKIIEFNTKLSSVMANYSDVDLEKRQRFLSNTGQLIVGSLFVNEIDEKQFEEAQNFLENSLDIITQDSQVFSLLEALRNRSDQLYAHSLGVSLYSYLIAKEMGWQKSSILYKLSFGGLVHDIGKRDLPEELLSKPKADLRREDKILLESHTWRGKEILEQMESIPEEVIAIAYQHHEACDGSGFPQKFDKKSIHPFAKIVAVANTFCDFVLESSSNPVVSTLNAINIMNKEYSDQFDEATFAALKALVNKAI